MRQTGKMHSATLAGSPQRLQVLLAFLDRAGAHGATAREIRFGCGVEAVSAAIDELRDNGVAIPWAVPEKRPAQLRKQYVYRLAKYAPEPAGPPVDGPLHQGKLFGEVG